MSTARDIDGKRPQRRSDDQGSASSVDGLTNGAAAKRTTPKLSSPFHRRNAADQKVASPVHQSISEPQTATPTPVHVQYNTFRVPFFSTVRSPRRECFTIHPEWASERIVPTSWMSSAQQHYQQQPPSTWSNTFPPPHTGRRCRSAPPGMRSRNPITWENWS